MFNTTISNANRPRFGMLMDAPEPNAKLAVENFNRIQEGVKKVIDELEGNGLWKNYPAAFTALGGATQATGVSIKYMA